ncbi:hypothetical protein [Methylomonas sp. AM2-LC]|uniref:hypothetical protein n=1 Tax=Methylomonas sp. AM2-LC TaxID=3153301 RepID=UPI003266313A
MPSLTEFKELVKSNPEQAFLDYVLEIDEESFDWQDSNAGIRAEPGPRDIEWQFEEPNKIKMYPSLNQDTAKKIYYLPWKNKSLTQVTLDKDSPAQFLTSEFSNCRFTIHYHDAEGKTVTVMHIAGDVTGGGSISGGNTRNDMETNAPLPSPAVRSRRLSVSKPVPGFKGAAWKKYDATAKDTVYYDSQAVVFGYRKKNGGWVFYAQNLDQNKVSKGRIEL